MTTQLYQYALSGEKIDLSRIKIRGNGSKRFSDGKYSKPKTANPLDFIALAKSSDENRPQLTFVNVRADGTAVASDGFRLHILPESNLAPGFYTIEKGVAKVAQCDKFYPDWQHIVPRKSPIQVQITKSALWRALQVSQVFAHESANIVKLSVWPDAIIIQSTSAEKGDSSIALVNGDEIDDQIITVKATGANKGFLIAANVKYFLDSLTAFKNDEVITLKFSRTESAFIVSGESTAAYAVVMPMYIAGSNQQPAARPVATIQAEVMTEAQPAPIEAPAIQPESVPAPIVSEPTETEIQDAQLAETVKKLGDETARLLSEGGYTIAKRQPRSEKGEANLYRLGYRPYTWDGQSGLTQNILGVWAKAPASRPTETELQAEVQPESPAPQPEPESAQASEQITTEPEAPVQTLPDLPYPGKLGAKVPKSPRRAIPFWVKAGDDWRKANQIELAHLCFAQATQIARTVDKHAKPTTTYALRFFGRWGKDWKIEATEEN